MPQAFTKNDLMTKSGSLKGLAAKYKVAQEGTTLGPEEVKEIAEETISVLADAADMIEAVAEGVPAEDSPITDDAAPSPLGDGDSDGVGGNGDDEEERRPVMGTDGQEDDDDREKRLMGKVASLQKEINNMKLASAKEKLASEYASLWPVKQAKQKHASFMKSKGSIEILQAKLDEAKSIMSSGAVKQASMPRPLYDSFNDESNERIASNNRRVGLDQLVMKV